MTPLYKLQLDPTLTRFYRLEAGRTSLIYRASDPFNDSAIALHSQPDLTPPSLILYYETQNTCICLFVCLFVCPSCKGSGTASSSVLKFALLIPLVQRNYFQLSA